MTKQDFRLSISAPVSAADAYRKIADVSAWWAKDFTGSARNLGDVFSVRFAGTAEDTTVDFKIAQAIPSSRIVWLVTNSYLPWLAEKTEWNNTKVIFEVTPGDGETTVTMTHEGLVPDVECYDGCVEGWTRHFGHSLKEFMTDGHGSPR